MITAPNYRVINNSEKPVKVKLKDFKKDAANSRDPKMDLNFAQLSSIAGTATTQEIPLMTDGETPNFTNQVIAELPGTKSPGGASELNRTLPFTLKGELKETVDWKESLKVNYNMTLSFEVPQDTIQP